MGRPVASNVHNEVQPRTFGYGQTVLQPETGTAAGGNGTHGEAKTEAPPPLGILARLESRTFSGFGFNTIFRPHGSRTPTKLDITPPPGPFPDDNILQLNLTKETMKFDKQLGEVPNRGLFTQADINLNGIPYTQEITDAMDKTIKKPPTLHYENGLWMHVPESMTPALPTSLARMGSIPHGTTINAQSFSAPVTSRGAPHIKKHQTASNKATFRLPQDLTPFTQAETITQEMLDNPNVVLSNANKGKDIVDSTTYTISTAPPKSTFGGATANIGFLVGDGSDDNNSPGRPNANAVQVTVTYWISTVRTKIHLEPFKPQNKDDKKTFSAVPLRPNDAVPTFTVDFEIPAAKTVTVEYTQLQYSQNVLLDFAKLSWPHATVATLAQQDVKLDASVLQQ
ncbi:Putative heme-binding protein, predicted [Colletotrichum destructivum]|uniref:Heme-binding protein, predicted n=1 Tax=Colletotrichum destructivum TaxID=34406 RepID=A0AAX4J2Q2_9PEZI|nr:Putative heme-binding protein, predicted [Colletotrichum destructivum]